MRLKKTIHFLLFMLLFSAAGFGQNPELLPVRVTSIDVGPWDFSQYRAKNILLSKVDPNLDPRDIVGLKSIIWGRVAGEAEHADLASLRIIKLYDGLTPKNFVNQDFPNGPCVTSNEMVECSDGRVQQKCDDVINSIGTNEANSTSKGGSVYVRYVPGPVPEFENENGEGVSPNGPLANNGAYVLTLSHDFDMGLWRYLASESSIRYNWIEFINTNLGYVTIYTLATVAGGPDMHSTSIPMATTGLHDKDGLIANFVTDLVRGVRQENGDWVIGLKQYNAVIRSDPKNDGTWDMDHINRRATGGRGRGATIGFRYNTFQNRDYQLPKGPRKDLSVCEMDDASYNSPTSPHRSLFSSESHRDKYVLGAGDGYSRGFITLDYQGGGYDIINGEVVPNNGPHSVDRVADLGGGTEYFNPIRYYAIPLPAWDMQSNSSIFIPIGNLDPKRIVGFETVIQSNGEVIDGEERIGVSNLNLDRHKPKGYPAPSNYQELFSYASEGQQFAATGLGGGIYFDADSKRFILNASGPMSPPQYVNTMYSSTQKSRGYILLAYRASHDGDHSMPDFYGDPLWMDLDIGATNIAQGTSQSTLDANNVARSFTIDGAGTASVTGASDAFRYTFKEPPEAQIVTFDADITIPGGQAQFTEGVGGLMIRQSLNPNSPFLFVGTNQAGQLIIRKRDVSGEVSENVLPPTSMTNTRVSIEINNYFTYLPPEPSVQIQGIEVSANSSVIHTSDLFITPPYYLGMAVSSGDNQNTFQSQFDNVEVGGWFVKSPEGDGSGIITRDVWQDISGTSVSSLTGNVDYPNNPTYTSVSTSFRGTLNAGDDYGTRMHGFVHPPSTGDYTFWIASDDNSELWLSTNDNPANKSLIASVPSWVSPEFWDQFSSQKSTTINLEKGKKYFIEAIAKEGVGLDNLAVAWEGPGITRQVIPGDHLSPVVGNPFDGRTFELKFVHSSKCLDAFNTFPGANVGQWNCHSGDNQKWKFNYQGNGYYMLKEIRDNLCLEVQDGSTSSAANVQVGDCNVSDKRQWQVIMPDSNVIQLKNKKSSKVVDVEGFSTASGANVIQYFSNGQDNQKLIFTEVSNGFVCEGDCLSAEPLAPEVNAVLNTTGERWYVVSQDLDGWQASEMAGRTIQVNGVTVSPGHMPLPPRVDGNYYFHFSTGDHSWASWGYWSF